MTAAQPTFATFEKEARALAAEQNADPTRGAVRRMAKKLQNDWLARHLAEGDMRNTNVLGITRYGVTRPGIADPTPQEAFQRINQNDQAAARRLGLRR